jgi:hypothetical protein
LLPANDISHSWHCFIRLPVGFLSPVAFVRQQTDTGPSVDLSHDAIITSVWIERNLLPTRLAAMDLRLTVTGNFDEAFRFAGLALRLMRRLGEDARTLVMAYGLLNHLKTPILDMTAPTLHAYHVAFAHGDLTFAGQAAAMHCVGRLVAGSNLDHLVADIFSFCDQLKAYKQIMALYIMASMQRSCLELTGRSDEMARVTGIVYDDTAFENYLKTCQG